MSLRSMAARLMPSFLSNAPMNDDIDTIMSLMDTSFDPLWGEAWNRRQLSDSLSMPHTQYCLIDTGCNCPPADDQAAGFALTKYVAGEEELLLIAVDPAHRSKGIGSALLYQCFQNAIARGAERIFLEMRDNNTARSIYERLGFEPIGRRKDYYTSADGTRIDAITFAKTLTQ